ncbi:coenzyme F420-0:L-glutamate ligase [Aceticella autotrophica]|uniref:Coenzyme F420-0:L-glutamate ligase n=1 Tax=Aceticella autotrophica TaxID=2755338 RepID=A0A975GAB3_9THEO|nr:coenzyme F420-0:L-glutamate ligase [Aceticella autotrophica]QSZ27203.1 coenzyme F420-0:L-glutamate ligase [Aceticella autotrophica]
MRSGKIPIRTHIITDKDDICDVVIKYTKDIAEPGDLIAIAESVVAISQGRAYLPEDIKADLLARILCKYTSRNGSLTSPQAMQCAINEVGWFRILIASIASAFGKLIHKSGFFFKIAGRKVALIDDVAGTMPPYHKYIILGPANPDKVCQAIKEATGIDTVIMDANDLNCADCIGASESVSKSYVEKLFLDNPSGNSEQQTPIVVIKDYLSLNEITEASSVECNMQECKENTSKCHKDIVSSSE